jgi:thioredoxin 1
VIPEWNASTFNKSLNANGYTFIEFGGKSCKPCKQMQGILKELKAKHPALAIGNVYMENSRDLLNAWKVQLIPTQVILDRNRKEITRHVGLWELKDILAEFKKRNITL